MLRCSSTSLIILFATILPSKASSPSWYILCPFILFRAQPWRAAYRHTVYTRTLFIQVLDETPTWRAIYFDFHLSLSELSHEAPFTSIPFSFLDDIKAKITKLVEQHYNIRMREWRREFYFKRRKARIWQIIMVLLRDHCRINGMNHELWDLEEVKLVTT